MSFCISCAFQASVEPPAAPSIIDAHQPSDLAVLRSGAVEVEEASEQKNNLRQLDPQSAAQHAST